MYARESFTESERSVLSRFFTNSDQSVFALINLPEIVKGALFARYSRTHKSLRRIFLDEFYEQPEMGLEAIAERIDDGSDASSGMRRAEELYDRVFIQYGDDSVAQLGGAHLACEQASALLAKVIERGRLAAYLEQSTRYIYYDEKIVDDSGEERYRYTVPPEVADGELAAEYHDTMDELFGVYSEIVRQLVPYFEQRFPIGPREKRGAYSRAIRARACDTARGLLPASTISNIGVFATGQAYEAMLIKMNAHPLAESREYAKMILTELRKVIPGFLKRVDVEDRGVAWSNYFNQIDSEMYSLAAGLESERDGQTDEFDYTNDEVRLLDWDDQAEDRLVAAALYAYSTLSEEELMSKSGALADDEKAKVISAYIGERRNRRHKPGRGFERIGYRFDVLSDFGSYRDLQRHRMMTLEWQRLSPLHGYATPPEIEEAGQGVVKLWHEAMGKMSDLYERLDKEHGSDVAQYAVPFAYRIRYAIQMNARQAFHMLELRTSEQGHSDYRRICLKMHELIRDKAGHRLIAEAMTYVDPKSYGLGRLSAERRQTEGEQLTMEIDETDPDEGEDEG